MTEELSYAQLIGMIRDLVEKKRAATLYIRTDQDRMVMVSTQGGKIITLSSGPKHGVKAVPLLRETHSAAVRIESTPVSYHSDEVPETDVLLAMLESDTQQTPTASTTPPGVPTVSSAETARIRAILSSLLTEYLGPMAPMCCDDVLEAVGSPLDANRLSEAVKQMAAEAGGPDEARAFTERAWKALKS
jgi:hypothetical protein